MRSITLIPSASSGQPRLLPRWEKGLFPLWFDNLTANVISRQATLNQPAPQLFGKITQAAAEGGISPIWDPQRRFYDQLDAPQEVVLVDVLSFNFIFGCAVVVIA